MDFGGHSSLVEKSFSRKCLSQYNVNEEKLYRTTMRPRNECHDTMIKRSFDDTKQLKEYISLAADRSILDGLNAVHNKLTRNNGK
jgi:hypothetical protein